MEFDKEVAQRYSKTLINATKKAIEVKYKNRPQDTEEMMNLMLQPYKPPSRPILLMIMVTIISAICTFFILDYLGV